MTNTTTATSTKWWWNKKPKSTTSTTKSSKHQKQKSVASSLNGADEGASMFSLYSYADTTSDSVYCPSVMVSSSMYAQHTTSEYSGNFSDIESTASIRSKPWISRNMFENKSIKSMLSSQQQEEQPKQEEEIVFSKEEQDEEEEYSVLKPSSTDESPIMTSSSSIVVDSSTAQPQEDAIVPTPKRRASLVDYIVHKPSFHGKLKVK